MLILSRGDSKIHDLFGEGFPSGQRDQTVNLTRKLRRFESSPLHQISWFCRAAVVARETKSRIAERQARLAGIVQR